MKKILFLLTFFVLTISVTAQKVDTVTLTYQLSYRARTSDVFTIPGRAVMKGDSVIKHIDIDERKYIIWKVKKVK